MNRSIVSACSPLSTVPARRRFEGVWNILRFNWPFYAATGACAAGTAVLTLIHWPIWLRVLGWSGVGLAIFWMLASLAVSFYVYDVSPLYKWTWLRSMFAKPPRSWVNIHSGFDETSLPLQALFPADKQQVLDIYNPQTMTEPSIERARATVVSPVSATPADFAKLPLPDDSVDAVFLIFAAHEIRESEDRLRFFRELKRITVSDARVILVEHVRDAANFLAFGPGFLHFMPQHEWQRLASQSSLEIDRRFRITPFVSVFVLQNLSD